MSTYYEIKADIKLEDGTTRTEALYGSYDRKDCVSEKECERDCWKEEGYKKIRIESREVEEKPDAEVYGDDIDPTTGEIREESEEEEEEDFTEEEELKLLRAKVAGYKVDGELASLYLGMEYANQKMLKDTRGSIRAFDHPSYRAAKVAYRAYWDAVDGK